MKTRSGYVSNSSSSSFIVMYNNDSKMVMKGRKKGSPSVDFTIQDFIDLIEHSPNYRSDCTEIIADGIENVESYLTEKDYSGYSRYDKEYANKIIEKMNANKDKYNEAAIFRVEYDDKFVRKLLEAFINSGEMLSLEEEEY